MIASRCGVIMDPCSILKSVCVLFLLLANTLGNEITQDNGENGERITEARSMDRVMYLNQGVEFVFPLGVHYTLANVNEQNNFPVSTTGFESVLEFPRNKMAIMFSSMVNTLRLANFSVYSTIYTNDTNVYATPALKILGSDVTLLGTKEMISPAATQKINKDVSVQTEGIITNFIPKAAYYGSAIYPFTKLVLANTIKYENQWAWPWKDGGFDSFSDSPLVPFMEVEGLMPYYENEAFAAVAALFKGGTGSVVFLKPKGNVTILQLMLQPTALTEIFDENFPGWGVKTLKVKIPVASLTTTTRHAETLQKRGVVDTFCSSEVRENLFGVLRVASSYFLNPIVQTNHVQISRDSFRIASATGATLNSQAQYDSIPRHNLFRDEAENSPVAEELVGEIEDEESKTESSLNNENSGQNSPSAEITTPATSESDIVSNDENLKTVDIDQIHDDTVNEEVDATTSQPETENISKESLQNDPANDSRPSKEDEKSSKQGDRFVPSQVESYIFDEPFLWFLHATNEEPMFMGIIESLKRYKEQSQSRVISLTNSNNRFGKDGVASESGSKQPFVDVVTDTANINLWNC